TPDRVRERPRTPPASAHGPTARRRSSASSGTQGAPKHCRSVPAWPPTEGAQVSRLLEHLGRRAVRHRWWFIGVWIIAAVAILVLAGSLDGQYSDNFRIPDTQSQSALDLLEKDSPAAAGDSALVVFETPDGITSSSVEPAISASVTSLGKIPNVTSVTNPYGPVGSAFI